MCVHVKVINPTINILGEKEKQIPQWQGFKYISEMIELAHFSQMFILLNFIISMGKLI
jgi:hypothetical protein